MGVTSEVILNLNSNAVKIEKIWPRKAKPIRIDITEINPLEMKQVEINYASVQNRCPPWLPGWDEEPVDADKECVQPQPQHHHGAPVEMPRPEVKLKWSEVSRFEFVIGCQRFMN